MNTKKTASVFACKNGICLQKVCLKRIEAHLRDLVYTQFCSSVLIETVKKTINFFKLSKKARIFDGKQLGCKKKLSCIKRTKQCLSTPTKKRYLHTKNCI